MRIPTLVLRISLVIFVTEAAIMLAFSATPESVYLRLTQNPVIAAFIDTLILTAVSAPVIYFWAVHPFVLAREKAEARVIAENRRFAEAQRIGKVGSWDFDQRGQSFTLSDEARRILRIDPQLKRISAKRYLGAIHAEDRNAVEKARVAFLSGDAEHNIVYRVQNDGEKTKWVRERGQIERASDGTAVKIAGTFHDITPQREAELAKSLFVANISHELRTPLTSIKGALALIQSGAAGNIPDKVGSMVEIALNNCNRLVALINDVLDLKKIEAGKMDFQMAIIDLASLILEAIDANEAFGREYGVTFNALVHHKPALVTGDKDRLMQVMNNLMSNAAKFSPEGGQVDIRLAFDGEKIVVSVHDYGTGIPKEVQPHIFDDFTQANTPERKMRGGTGLGLSIAKKIVERHEGTIDFSSEVGRGTTFFVKLKPNQAAN
jgi:signal transduction histidine kinase